jgi:diguanylate cyclase (GGDEF)-like protein
MQAISPIPQTSASSRSIEEQKRIVVRRVYWIALIAFISALSMNPGEPGISDQYNRIAFGSMLVINIAILILIQMKRLSIKTFIGIFLVQYTTYFFASFFYAFFIFPSTQDIHVQLVPLLPYLSLYLLGVYIFLDLKWAQIYSIIYTLLFLAGMLIYSNLHPTERIPSPIVTAYYQEFLIVNFAIVLIFMASGHIKKILSRTEEKTAEIEKIAFTDDLTGLDNRLFFNSVVEQEFKRFRETGANPFSLVIADIDFFKKINDQFGHDKGDLALKEMASVLRQSVRSSDLIARWGGEEFVIMLAHIPKDVDIRAVVDRLCKTVEGHKFPELPKVTASFGLASIQESDANIEEMFKRADQALYKAKSAGRNRVEGPL